MYNKDMFITPMAPKRAQAKYAVTAFNSKCKYEKLAVVFRVPQTTQNFTLLGSLSHHNSVAEDNVN